MPPRPAASRGSSPLLVPILFHLHQPVGNFPGTFEYAYRRSYSPLVEALSSSGLKFNLHISGALLDWLLVNRRPFIELLRSLVIVGRLEILGGGYYEPILPMIPAGDRHRQLTRLFCRVEELFGRRPWGAWLAERVWEPELAADLARAGYRYTLLDHRHFLDLGWRPVQMHSIFSTEHDGEVLAVFPIDEPIRYLIPWEEPERTVEYLAGCRPIAPAGRAVVVVMSDAETMGLWPARRGTTYDLCYRDGWMARFLSGLSDPPWIETVLLSEALEQEPPRRLVYLPTASYDRMGVWALPTEARSRLESLPGRLEKAGLAPELRLEVKRFARGTHWRNFLVKYPAAGRLHLAYLHTRDRLAGAEDALEPAEADRLLDLLDAAAVNDGYWHGLFGGVYYHFLRHHCYRCLAEVLARLDRGSRRRVVECDYERLGRPGVVVSDPEQTLVLDHGGAVLDWLSKAPPAGLAGGFTRIPEPYHRGNERGFTVDRARRGFCRLVVMPGNAAKERLLAGTGVALFPELTGPVVRGSRVGYTGSVSPGGGKVGVELAYSPVRGGWGCTVTLVNTGSKAVAMTLALDSSPSPPSGPRDLELTFHSTGSSGPVPQKITGRHGRGSVASWSLADRRAGLVVTSEAEPAASLWSSPVITVEGTEAGIKRSWQGLQLVWAWSLSLAPGEERRMEARFTLSTGGAP
ncbi:MAG: hypothetical protein A2Y64_05075 [Candidatus Coatesbacteria bacterium RBG_13_66_14]|uniref:Glycoside hydrolase family 57 N-terminal domain-containing protein n=1 Tax=Candidatus Coatesbacteria bacterium RBG_13_66_14 TaxID=1817816 RepID=A0A1F5F622_9BACT|nr:MAG: hypothetical protein A2Y64_05075 [Candidatus Coatesbacteria bacterium RBG_13_66_14]